jgi:hypothetical protein
MAFGKKVTRSNEDKDTRVKCQFIRAQNRVQAKNIVSKQQEDTRQTSWMMFQLNLFFDTA